MNPDFERSEVRRKIDDFTEFLRQASLPISAAYTEEFHAKLDDIDSLCPESHPLRKPAMEYTFSTTSKELDQSIVHHHGRHKPFGYPGDYLAIDYTYQRICSSTGREAVWDEFYHQQDAPIAVCKRKDRFGHELAKTAANVRSRPLRVLNVASGPCREIVDGAVTAEIASDELGCLCIEVDPEAVEYARTVLGSNWNESVRFHVGNALRFRTDETFHLVWSAGLFDYLSERAAKLLLRRLWRCLDRGGRLVIGNLAETHRTRPYIEWCGAWFLRHRTADELDRLAHDAGIRAPELKQEVDELGAIRFLIADKPA